MQIYEDQVGPGLGCDSVLGDREIVAGGTVSQTEDRVGSTTDAECPLFLPHVQR